MTASSCAGGCNRGRGAGSTETGSCTLADGITLTRTANAYGITVEDEWQGGITSVNTYWLRWWMTPRSQLINGVTEINFRRCDPYSIRMEVRVSTTICIGGDHGAQSYGVCNMGGNAGNTDTLAWPSVNRISRGGELLDPETPLRNTSQQPYDPTTEGDLLGLRLAYIVPEPTTCLLFSLGIPFLALGRRRGLPGRK